MKREVVIGFSLVIGIVVFAVGALAISAGSGSAGPPGVVSNSGTSIDISGISAQQESALASTGVTGDPRLLGVRGGRAFYRFSGDAGQSCYAVGRAAVGSPPSFGAMACPEGFPSEQSPILDQSVFALDPATGAARVLAVEGIAGDGVARVGVLDTAGNVYTAKVENNLYRLSSPPKSPARAIVAFDAAGSQIFTLDLTRG